MVRSFLDEFEIELSRRRRRLIPIRGTITTGTLFFETLQRSINRLNEKLGADLRVLPVENRFMGTSVTVAGLLSGRDIAAAIDGKEAGDFVVVPSEAISRADGIFVDDLSLQDLSESIGKPVYAGGKTAHDFFRLLFKIGRRQQ